MNVSLCVIAFNEENYLEDLMENILSQDYPHAKIEIIYVDGRSLDNTKEIMLSFQKNNITEFKNIKILDNEKRIQSSGWNIAINASEEEVVIRVDAHALIPEDFVSKNVECIESGENICGGKRTNIIKGTSKRKKILLMAENSMFGSGVATYRHSGKKQYVKTLAHACYRKSVFDDVGLFNEKLLRSEDNELHYRMRKKGYRFCLSDDISTEYQTRSTFGSMVKQKFGNGKWVGITSKISPKIFSIYHYIPFVLLFIAVCSLFLFIIPFFKNQLWGLGIPFVLGAGLYVCVDILLSFKSALDYKEPLGILVLPFLFPVLHFAYGIGTLVGFIKMPFVKLK